MKNCNAVLFDLDGTLTDPGIGITNSVAFALKRFGIDVDDKRELYRFIGPPLIDSFVEYYGFTPEKAREAVVYYREYYADKGIFENLIYEGIPELLAALENEGKMIILATSKPEGFSKQILEHFGILKYFDFVAGATNDETRTKKDEVIAFALESCKLKNREGIVMVGDRCYDIAGAGLNGLDSVGVLFGYGSREELEEAGATRIAATVDELSEILL